MCLNRLSRQVIAPLLFGAVGVCFLNLLEVSMWTRLVRVSELTLFLGSVGVVAVTVGSSSTNGRVTTCEATGTLGRRSW